MPVIPFLPMIIGTATSLIGAAKQNSAAGRTATSGFERTSTTEGHLGRKQKRLRSADLKALLDLVQAGPNVLQSDRNLMRTQTNNTYNAIAPKLEASLTSRGFGNSGKLGAGFKGLEIARANQIQTGEAGLRREALDRWMRSIGMSSQFLQPLSSTTTEKGTGSQTGPSQTGNIIGGAGFALSQFLKSLNLGGGGGGDFLTSGSGVGVNFGDSGDLFDLGGWKG